MAGKWIEIETAKEFVVYLTQHKDDLFPVCAYRVGPEWRRQIEGPEDAIGGDRHGLLYRNPTHFKILEVLPINEGAG